MRQAELLIVRAVSFQQLDAILPMLRRAFPDHRLVLLTHPHGVPLAAAYPELAEVVAYPHKGAFQFWRSADVLKERCFADVVVPVTSGNGGGFFNVFAFAVLGVRARRRHVCGPTGALQDLSAVGLLRRAAWQSFAAVLAGAATLLALPALLLVLPVRLMRMRSRKG